MGRRVRDIEYFMGIRYYEHIYRICGGGMWVLAREVPFRTAASLKRRQCRVARRLVVCVGDGAVSLACMVTFAAVTHSIERSARVPCFVRVSLWLFDIVGADLYIELIYKITSTIVGVRNVRPACIVYDKLLRVYLFDLHVRFQLFCCYYNMIILQVPTYYYFYLT